MLRRRLRRAHTILPLLMVLSLACDLSPDPVQLGLAGGTLRGKVLTGGIHEDMTVEAIRVDGLPQTALTAKVPVEEDGSYSIDVPAGRYVVELKNDRSYTRYAYRRAGLSFGIESPDTVLINDAHSPRVVDFPLSSLRVDLQVSPELNGEFVSLTLHHEDHPLSRFERGYERHARQQVVDGKVELQVTGVLPGDYRIELELGSRFYLDGGATQYAGERVWYPGARGVGQASIVEFQVDQTTELGANWAQGLSRISGRVSGAWEDLALGVPSIALVDPDSNVVRGFRITGRDGIFNEGLHFPGPVKVAVGQDGVVRWFGGDSFETASVYNLQRNQTVEGLDMVGSGVELTLQPPHQSLDLLGEVRFHRAEDGREVARWSQRLSTHGTTYRIANLAAGNYLMQFVSRSKGRSPWITQWFDGVIDMRSATPIVIQNPGEVVRLNVTLLTGATLSGGIVDAVEEQEGYTVVLARASETTICGTIWLFGDQKDFSLLGLGDGDYKVGVLRGHRYSIGISSDITWFPGVQSWEDAATVRISGLEDVTGIEIPLPSSEVP